MSAPPRPGCRPPLTPTHSYNEQLHDLLNPSTQSDNLRIAEDPKSGPYVKNCTETIVTSAEQTLELIKKGEMSRHYGATRMNDMSSRSHVMFRCLIKRGFVSKTSGASGVMAAKAEPHDPADGEAIISNGEAAPWHDNPNIPHRISALYFVDLAGSEKTAKTGATGATLKESNSINKSLLTLGTVINRLSDGTRAQHIPYVTAPLPPLLRCYCGSYHRRHSTRPPDHHHHSITTPLTHVSLGTATPSSRTSSPRLSAATRRPS